MVFVLNSPKLMKTKNETIIDTRKREKWETNDEICMRHILNAMSDSLFDVNRNVPIAKELCDKLKMKYMQEDATSKKFLVSKFNICKMNNGRPVMEQFADIEKVLNHFSQHKMHMDETITVSSIIDQLPLFGEIPKKALNIKKKRLLLIILLIIFVLKRNFACRMRTKILMFLKCM